MGLKCHIDLYYSNILYSQWSLDLFAIKSFFFLTQLLQFFLNITLIIIYPFYH